MPARREKDTAIALHPREKKHHSKRKRRSSHVIHITVGTRNKNRTQSVSKKEKKRSTIKSEVVQYGDSVVSTQPNSQTQISDSIKLSFLTRSSRVAHHEQRINQSSDQTGTIDHYHRNPIKLTKKTKKCTLPCIVVVLLVIVVIVAITLSVSLTLLLKSRTRTTPTSTPVLRWNKIGITVAGVVGSSGNGNNQFNLPVDVLLDRSNNLYVTDCYNNRIQKFMFNGQVGQTIAGNGAPGPSPSQLASPTYMLLDDNENLYIADTNNYRVQYWTTGATNGTTVAGVSGVLGNTDNKLGAIYGIARDPTSGTLYMSDYTYNRLVSYAVGAQNTTLLLGDQGAGVNRNQLYRPVGLSYDSFSNSFLIANFGGHTLVRYVLGATNWTLVAGNINGTASASPTYLNSPTGVTYDPMGNVYVADCINNRIQFFSNEELMSTTIAGITGVGGRNATTLLTPYGIRLDNQLNMYVADSGNHRIQKFLRY